MLEHYIEKSFVIQLAHAFNPLPIDITYLGSFNLLLST